MSATRTARRVEPPRGYLRSKATVTNGRGCRGKVRHAKRKQALTALNGHRAAHPEDPRPLGVYRCQECRGWHVGHS